MIEIVAAGPGLSVQDGGRPGYAALGVARSGAFDRPALALANRLVGNTADAAGLEITLGGLEFRASAAVTVAITGAPLPGPLGWGLPVTLPRGSLVATGRPARGLRSYLAVRGGVAVAAVLGSRSTDTLSGLGPPAVVAGDRLVVGAGVGPVAGVDAIAPRAGVAAVPVRLGPREDWFTAAARDLLVSTAWTVRADSDRVGVRLAGPALARAVAGELPSEATLPGALQVPGDGRPIVLGPDAPVTGGYPVIGVLADGGLAHMAQLRPGDEVRFRYV